jgi:hypothetical protein
MFGAAVIVTAPEPLMLVQIASAQPAFELALHEHDVPPVTVALKVPPRAGSVAAAGETVSVHV